MVSGLADLSSTWTLFIPRHVFSKRRQKGGVGRRKGETKREGPSRAGTPHPTPSTQTGEPPRNTSMRTNVSTDSPIATLAESTLLPVSVRPLVTPVPNWSSTKSAPTAVTMNGVEWIGLVTVTVLTLKIVYNLVSFFYTAFVGAALGRNIDLSQHGPWAGTRNFTCSL